MTITVTLVVNTNVVPDAVLGELIIGGETRTVVIDDGETRTILEGKT